GYGFYWFRLATNVAPPEWHTDRRPVEDLAVLVLFDGWNSLFRDRVVPWRIAMAGKTLAQFETELLPRFMTRQRWFGGAAAPARAQLVDHALLEHGGRDWLLALLDSDSASRWFVPLGLGWEDHEEDRLRQLAPAALAKVRMQAQVGLLADALADPLFGQALVEAIANQRELRTAHGLLRFVPAAGFTALAGPDVPSQTHLQPLAASHGSVVQLGERLLLKVLRRVSGTGEFEMTRFLSEVAGFEHSAPLAGSVQYQASDGTHHTVALLLGYVPNQGDAFAYAVEQLSRQLERPPAIVGMDDNASPAFEEGLLARIRKLGERTAALHGALARPTGDPAFDPVRSPTAGGLQTRIHGAYRLQEVLLVNDDFVIIDFQGGEHQSPLRDVSSMLRSFDSARATALQQSEGQPEAEAARREKLSQHWLLAVSEAFVKAYGEAAVAAGLWPDQVAFDAALASQLSQSGD
ncbi:MAG TPA: alpha-amylase, partial [Rubrivivax sp.]|nr:alpha-amylase [Rubrivivax sp.]